MNELEHERLDVYRAAIEFLVVADEIATSLPKGAFGASGGVARCSCARSPR